MQSAGFFISCTSNPFWNDPGTVELILSGTVTTENNHMGTPVFVWSKIFDSYTKTDQDGKFSVLIKNNQTPHGSISGSIKIYFFIYNYEMDSAIVNFTNGRLSKNQADFSLNGELIKHIHLTKILSGELEPQILENKFYDQNIIRLFFNIDIHQSVNIDLYKYIWDEDTLDFHSGLIFQNIENDSLVFYRYSAYDDYGNIINDQLIHLSFEVNEHTEWEYFINTNQLTLLPGEYKILPYFIISHNFIPLGMINAMGGDQVFSFSNKYLNMPIDIIPGSIIID